MYGDIAFCARQCLVDLCVYDAFEQLFTRNCCSIHVVGDEATCSDWEGGETGPLSYYTRVCVCVCVFVFFRDIVLPLHTFCFSSQSTRICFCCRIYSISALPGARLVGFYCAFG